MLFLRLGSLFQTLVISIATLSTGVSATTSTTSAVRGGTTKAPVSFKCQDNAVNVATALLKKIPPASSFCSSYLKRSPIGSPSTQTVTASAITTTTSGVIISTQSQGIVTSSTVIFATATVGMSEDLRHQQRYENEQSAYYILDLTATATKTNTVTSFTTAMGTVTTVVPSFSTVTSSAAR